MISAPYGIDIRGCDMQEALDAWNEEDAVCEQHVEERETARQLTEAKNANTPKHKRRRGVRTTTGKE